MRSGVCAQAGPPRAGLPRAESPSIHTTPCRFPSRSATREESRLERNECNRHETGGMRHTHKHKHTHMMMPGGVGAQLERCMSGHCVGGHTRATLPPSRVAVRRPILYLPRILLWLGPELRAVRHRGSSHSSESSVGPVQRSDRGTPSARHLLEARCIEVDAPDRVVARHPRCRRVYIVKPDIEAAS